MSHIDNRLRSKLEEIKTILIDENSTNDISLLRGRSGEALFLFHYYELTKDKHVLNKAYEFLDFIFLDKK